MRLIEPIKKAGRLRAYIIDPNWKGAFPTRWPRDKWPVIEKVIDSPNLMTNAGRLLGYRTGYNFSFIAGGTGATDPAATDIHLRTEVGRFEITDIVMTIGQVEIFAEIPPDTGNLTWEEWGVFMQDATRIKNSGTLFSRLLSQYTKNIGDTVLLNYTMLETI